MRRIPHALAAAALLLGAGGCARTVHHERKAAQHEARAARAAERGYYDRAADHQQRSHEHRQKAQEVVPTPAPPPP